MNHGQSDYTPIKQNHLRGILKIGTKGWNPQYKPWAHDTALVIDCTSGNGHAETGEDGSPVIINNHFANVTYPYRQLCCEQVPTSFVRLQQAGLNADLHLGRYQDGIMGWLDAQNVRMDKPALGFVYCDPNGVKDLLEGYAMFQGLNLDKRYSRLDFVFHWSLTAYQRSFGANITWANDELSDIIRQILTLKQYAIIREPADKHRWVIMYLFNTDKVDGVWRSQGFLPADEWTDKYLLAKGQRPLFDEQVLAEMSA